MYAFEHLEDKKGAWSLDELESRLPSGLEDMCTRVLSTLCDALKAEAPELLTLLTAKLLPVLVASKAPMTLEELAWATDAELSQV